MDSPVPSLSPEAIGVLMTHAVAGDADALEALIVLHHARLRAAARRLIGPDWAGRIDADDLLQEAYIGMFRDIAGFRPGTPESFFAWAREVVRHRFIDAARHMRRKKRAATNELRGRALHELLTQIGRACPSVSAGLRREEAHAALLACMARLPERYRAVVRRIHLDGADWSEVSNELGKSEDALRRLAGRALGQLADCLGRASHFLTTLH